MTAQGLPGRPAPAVTAATGPDTGRRRMTRLVAAVAALALTLSCTARPAGSPGAIADQTPGDRPADHTTEGGLWMVMDRAERDVKTSGRVIRDPALQDYVNGLVCRLTPDYCADIRVYLIEQPYFNAMMAPNGMMQVWSGLLLRARDEAELAYVLAHELGHYIRRHSLQQFEATRDTASGLAFVSLFTLGLATIPATLLGIGSIQRFSRDQEREADEQGFDMMVAAGYDPGAAAGIWDLVVREREAEDDDSPSLFFASHPPTEDRIERLTQRRDDLGRTGIRNHDAYRAVMRQWRPVWMEQELRKRRLAAAQIVLDHVYDGERSSGEALYFQGEIYRLRAGAGDDDRAAEAYARAVVRPDVPPQAWRVLGDVRRRKNDPAGAHEAYRTYLRAAPDAADRAIVERYLEK